MRLEISRAWSDPARSAGSVALALSAAALFLLLSAWFRPSAQALLLVGIAFGFAHTVLTDILHRFSTRPWRWFYWLPLHSGTKLREILEAPELVRRRRPVESPAAHALFL